jgi:hypothetical protein
MEAWMNNVLERLPGAIGTQPAAIEPFTSAIAGGNGSPLGSVAGDRIRQLITPALSFGGPADGGVGGGMGNALTGGGWGIIAQLLSIVQQLVSFLGFGAGAQGGLQTYFQNANGSSTGDPHLAFDGADISGNNIQARFDSMTGHADLLDSDSFEGGYQVSTTTTQPGANGITYNQQATISTNYGQTQVSLDKNGNAFVLQNGEQFALTQGESYDLGNGETVTRNSDGSVVVSDANARGGSISTTLSQNGSGVDVRTQAHGVDLGGDLVKQTAHRHRH